MSDRRSLRVHQPGARYSAISDRSSLPGERQLHRDRGLPIMRRPAQHRRQRAELLRIASLHHDVVEHFVRRHQRAALAHVAKAGRYCPKRVRDDLLA
jgi:hypothetical protein